MLPTLFTFLGFLGVLFLVVSAISLAQYLQYFIRRRWTKQIVLPDPVGFADPVSMREDAEIVLKVSSSETCVLTFYRCGAEGFQEVARHEVSPGLQSGRMGRWTGFDWPAALTLPPHALAPGLYYVEIRGRNAVSSAWRTPLIITPADPRAILVVSSTNTWNAYNHFGGLSNYRDIGGIPWPLKFFEKIARLTGFRSRIGDRHWFPIIPLPEKRPNLAIHDDLADLDTSEQPKPFSHLLRGESHLITLLEREGLPYSIVSDRDFIQNSSLTGVKLVVFNTHPEYWSEESLGRVLEAVDSGVNVAIFGGNTSYRQIQFLRDSIAVIAQIADRDSVARVVGLYYDSLGYLSRAGYRTLKPDHWCFHGLQLKLGEVWGEAVGASGYETDKICGISHDIEVLAIGTNPEGPAYMICRENPNGSFLFNAGSLAFTDGLLRDDQLATIVRNVLRQALERPLSRIHLPS